MQFLLLCLGIFGHPAAPLPVTVGMPIEQAHILLGGFGDIFLASGPLKGPGITERYFAARLTVFYQDGKVQAVHRTPRSLPPE